MINNPPPARISTTPGFGESMLSIIWLIAATSSAMGALLLISFLRFPVPGSASATIPSQQSLSSAAINAFYGNNTNLWPLLIIGLPLELAAITLSILIGTYSSHRSDRRAWQKAQDLLQLRQDGSKPLIASDPAFQRARLSYAKRLRRNVLICMMFLPLSGLILYADWTLWNNMQLFGKGADKQALIYGLIFVPLIGMRIAWWGAARLFDGIIARQGTNSTTTTQEPIILPVSRTLANILGTVLGSALSLVPFLLLSVLGTVVPTTTLLPPAIGFLLTVAVVGGYYALLGVLARQLLPKLFPEMTKVSNQNPTQTSSPETADITISKDTALDNPPPRTTAPPPSALVRAQQRIFVIFSVLVVCAVSISLTMPQILNTDPKHVKDVFAGTLFVTFFGSTFLLLPLLIRIFGQNPKMAKMHKTYMDALRRADYDTALKAVEEGMQAQPGAETQIPAMIVHASMGHIEKMESLARQTRQDLDSPISEQELQLNRISLGIVYGVLAETYFWMGRLTEADTAVKQALALRNEEKVNYPVHKTAARIALYQGNAAEAEKHLNAADRGYKASRTAPNLLHQGLYAWLYAVQGQSERAEQMFIDVLPKFADDQITEHAEMHMVHGFAYQAMHKPQAARNAFRDAAELDPHGINNIAAQREIKEQVL